MYWLGEVWDNVMKVTFKKIVEKMCGRKADKDEHSLRISPKSSTMEDIGELIDE